MVKKTNIYIVVIKILMIMYYRVCFIFFLEMIIVTVIT